MPVTRTRLLLAVFSALTLTLFSHVGNTRAIVSPVDTTLAHFRQVGCLEETTYEYYKGIVRTLSYSKLRAFRAFCSLEDITGDEAVATLQQLVFYPLRFDQAELLESFLTLDGATPETGWELLEVSAKMQFTAAQAAASMKQLTTIEPETFLILLGQLQTLDDSGCWAAKALFSIPSISPEIITVTMDALAQMSAKQHLAAERSFLAFGDTQQFLVPIMKALLTLSESDANIVASLLDTQNLSPQEALSWVQDYFIHPGRIKEQRYNDFTPAEKSILLDAFSEGSDHLIWKINNLHAVTDGYGSEISTGALARSSNDQLLELFEALHPKAQQRYRDQLENELNSNKRYDAVATLKEATALARKLTASDLTSANIYILLSHGSELYDSSFRDILVPVLLKRIGKNHGANVFSFLLSTDPENGYVSDFIISCAQKGKLTAFFPTDPEEQRNILDLVAASAFQDEQSLILFSATFNTLLQKIEPPVRTYLLNKIIATIQQPESAFALQLRVILQYYLDKFSTLLSTHDKQKITSLIARYGSVDLTPFTRTDFSRWKADGQLASLSIFQYDDDGSLSYRSYSNSLLNNGYKLRLSKHLSLLSQHDSRQQAAAETISMQKTNPSAMIRQLFRLSTSAPVIVEWYKSVNGLELSHAVTVYQNETSQQLLLRQFIEQRMEMFAQRGHSYWRKEQLLEPMKQLIETGLISTESILAINRFMSIGSCGGLRIYTQLNKLFNNSIDIMATVGTGKAIVNDPYNRQLFEIVATSPDQVSWEEIGHRSASIFAEGRGSDYLLPGSLPAILHKMMDAREVH